MSMKMLGTATHQKLKLKAGETWGLSLYLLHVLNVHPARIEDQHRLLEAGRCLEELVQVFNACGSGMSAGHIQTAFDKFLRHMTLTESDDELLIPKRHMVLHMLRDIPWLGNPKYYASWEDASLNKTLQKCCGRISQVTSEASILVSMRKVLAAQSRKRKQRD